MIFINWKENLKGDSLTVLNNNTLGDDLINYL